MVRKSKLITAPDILPVSTEEMKLWVKQDDDADDSLIDALIRAGVEMVETYTGKRLITQTWARYFDSFPLNGYFYLNNSPIQSITSITYYDAQGDSQTLSTDVYALENQNEDRSRVYLKENQIFPNTQNQLDSVTVTYVCGFGDASADVPDT